MAAERSVSVGSSKGMVEVSSMVELLFWEDDYGSRMKEEKNSGGRTVSAIVQVM